MSTYRPAMNHNEGLCFWVEFALFDGFWPAGHNVAHVIIWDVRCAQGELGHNVSVVCDPFSCGRQGSGGDGDGGVYCDDTHRQTQTVCSRLLDYYGGVHAKSEILRMRKGTYSIIITHLSSMHPCNHQVKQYFI